MSFTDTQIASLSGPLARDAVSQRQQGGGKVSYIEAWHAIAEANRIFGFDAWNRETFELRQLGEPILGKDRHGNDQWRVNYLARVRITVGDIVREGSGFGQGIDKDVGQAHESGLKEAETDAMKRALMTFGNPFGLALYDKSQASVADTPREPAKPEELSNAQLDAIAKIDECETVQRLEVWTESFGKLFPDGSTSKRVAGAAFTKRKKAIEAMDRVAA